MQAASQMPADQRPDEGGESSQAEQPAGGRQLDAPDTMSDPAQYAARLSQLMPINAPVTGEMQGNMRGANRIWEEQLRKQEEIRRGANDRLGFRGDGQMQASSQMGQSPDSPAMPDQDALNKRLTERYGSVGPRRLADLRDQAMETQSIANLDINRQQQSNQAQGMPDRSALQRQFDFESKKYNQMRYGEGGSPTKQGRNFRQFSPEALAEQKSLMDNAQQKLSGANTQGAFTPSQFNPSVGRNSLQSLSGQLDRMEQGKRTSWQQIARLAQQHPQAVQQPSKDDISRYNDIVSRRNTHRAGDAQGFQESLNQRARQIFGQMKTQQDNLVSQAMNNPNLPSSSQYGAPFSEKAQALQRENVARQIRGMRPKKQQWKPGEDQFGKIEYGKPVDMNNPAHRARAESYKRRDASAMAKAQKAKDRFANSIRWNQKNQMNRQQREAKQTNTLGRSQRPNLQTTANRAKPRTSLPQLYGN